MAEEYAPDSVNTAKGGLYRVGAWAGDTAGLDLAASNLRHYLDGTGRSISIDHDQMRSYGRVQNLEHKNLDELQNWIQSSNLQSMADGESRTLEPWETRSQFAAEDTQRYGAGTISEGFKHALSSGKKGEAGGIDLGLALGKSYLQSSGNFNAVRDGDTINVTGDIHHQVPDLYNFERRPKTFINDLAANWPADLEKGGKAKSFDLISQWQQPMSASIKIGPDGQLHSPHFSWGETQPYLKFR